MLALVPAIGAGVGSGPAAAEEADAATPEPGCVLVVPSLEGTTATGAVRFQPATGRVWGVLRRLSGELRFVAINPTAIDRQGPFEIEASVDVSQLTGWEAYFVRVFDPRSGRRWGGTVAAREPTEPYAPVGEEPDEEGDAETIRWSADPYWSSEREPDDARVPEASSATPAAFLLCASRRGGELLLGRRDTGRTWENRSNSWVELPDAQPPGAGDYELRLGSAEENLPIRMDRTTGRAWTAPEQTWVLVPEAPAPAGSPPASRDRPCEFFLYPQGKHGGLARWQPHDGRAWIVDGSWTPVVDPEPVPPGPYVLRVVPNAKRPEFLRLDPRTGRLWSTPDRRTWKEAVGAPVPSGDVPRFDLLVAGRDAKTRVVEFDRRDGGTLVRTGGGFAQVPQAPLPASEYDAQAALGGDGRGYLARLDVRSGRWDVLGEAGWAPVRGVPAPVEPGSQTRFRQRIVATSDGGAAARLDVKSGETWLWAPQVQPFSDQPALRVAEPRPAPPGDYEIHAQVPQGEGRGRAAVWLRFERRTGRTWSLEPVAEGTERVATWVEIL